jgi:hypothetical protein
VKQVHLAKSEIDKSEAKPVDKKGYGEKMREKKEAKSSPRIPKKKRKK